MDEYEGLGHMKEVPPTRIPTDHYFIPHHCVLKPESSTTKLRVVFDASCKTTSNKSLNDILYAGPTNLPLGAAVLKHDFYVDDCLTGANSIPEAVQIQQELNKILLPAGFKLRKWCSNNDEVLAQIPKEDVVSYVKLDETLQHYSVKTLGLIWVPNKDQLCGRSQKSEASTITKRVVSSEASQIFDPLGLFAPVVVKAKIFMQSLWELKMGWDDELPQLLQTEWKNYRADLQALNNLQIPRHIFDGKVPINQEIHTFVDASERAYGAAIYVRATYKNNQVSVRLLCSKSRVAPTAKRDAASPGTMRRSIGSRANPQGEEGFTHTKR
nr:uncharacterized protein LOC121502008 [Drosophila kikkawai]